MRRFLCSLVLPGIACVVLTQCTSSDPVTRLNAAHANPRQIAADSRAVLQALYRQTPSTRQLGARAKGILVFPAVTKGGFMLGGLGGNGGLIDPDGKVREFYQTGGISYGLQAGIQKYSYALFLMDNEARANLRRSGGWELGSSPSLVIVDEGMAASLSVGSINKGTYAFLFHQRGLMGGLSLQGSKITRFYPGN